MLNGLVGVVCRIQQVKDLGISCPPVVAGSECGSEMIATERDHESGSSKSLDTKGGEWKLETVRDARNDTFLRCLSQDWWS